MTVHPAGERFVTDQTGIRTWHAFSAGPHYDPANVSFGPVIGCDEHVVRPGAGFDWHAHRGVVIVSWVLSGTLRHEDDGDTEFRVGAGQVLVQSTGDGIRHRETNPSDDEQLRFVQTTLLIDRPRAVELPVLPSQVGEVTIDLVRGPGQVGPAFVVIGADGAAFDGAELESGDTIRLDRPNDLEGQALILAW